MGGTIPVLVEAVRNTSTAVEDEDEITDRGLGKALIEVKEKLAKLGPEKMLINKEWREQI